MADSTILLYGLARASQLPAGLAHVVADRADDPDVRDALRRRKDPLPAAADAHLADRHLAVWLNMPWRTLAEATVHLTSLRSRPALAVHMAAVKLIGRLQQQGLETPETCEPLVGWLLDRNSPKVAVALTSYVADGSRRRWMHALLGTTAPVRVNSIDTIKRQLVRTIGTLEPDEAIQLLPKIASTRLHRTKWHPDALVDAVLTALPCQLHIPAAIAQAAIRNLAAIQLADDSTMWVGDGLTSLILRVPQADRHHLIDDVAAAVDAFSSDRRRYPLPFTRDLTPRASLPLSAVVTYHGTEKIRARDDLADLLRRAATSATRRQIQGSLTGWALRDPDTFTAAAAAHLDGDALDGFVQAARTGTAWPDRDPAWTLSQTARGADPAPLVDRLAALTDDDPATFARLLDLIDRRPVTTFPELDALAALL